MRGRRRHESPPSPQRGISTHAASAVEMTSRRPLLAYLETKEYRENHDSRRNQWLDNVDLRPVPSEQRTYGWQAYFWFWLSANATPATFYGVSAALAAGLSLWEALACQLAGQSKFLFNIWEIQKLTRNC